jgi:hypothetical protein
MRINIDQLTEAELIDLNRRIVERLRMLHQMHAHVRMLEFHIGERVCFEGDQQKVIEGTLVRYNKKSVTVVTDEGGRWTVSPAFLRRASSTPSVRKAGKVIEADELGNPFQTRR